MPHNRTRFWVGLAIAAVTIPALGLVYQGLSHHDLQGNGASRNGSWSAGTGLHSVRPLATNTAAPPENRDYVAEVERMTGKRIVDPSAVTATSAPVDPVDQAIEDATANDDEGYVSDLPDPAQAIAPAAPPSDGQSADDGNGYQDSGSVPPPDNGSTVADQGPSDREIYNMMLQSFNDQDRDTFVRTWALMSDEQRQKVLDDYRNNN